jgi:hypothetical protein
MDLEFEHQALGARTHIYDATTPDHDHASMPTGATLERSLGLYPRTRASPSAHGRDTHCQTLLPRPTQVPSGPPDLYAALAEEQLAPTMADLFQSDPDLVPYEQDLRFDNDLYTPRWVRGHGNKREGWCGICRPGRWLLLKNSAFWYDKSFTHGISAVTGTPFQRSIATRRAEANPDEWQGSCDVCSEWVALVSSKKKGISWFRHAYKVPHIRARRAPLTARSATASPDVGAPSVGGRLTDRTLPWQSPPKGVVSGLRTREHSHGGQ